MNLKEISEDPHKKLTKNTFQHSFMQNTVEASFSLGKAAEHIKLNSNTITDDDESLIEEEIQLRTKQNLYRSREYYNSANSHANASLLHDQMDCFKLYTNNGCRNINTDSGRACHERKFNNGRWSTEEHQKFIEAMFLYGNEWKKVQLHIKSRSSTQARSHAQKFFIRLRKIFLYEEDENDKTKSGQIIPNSIKCSGIRRNEKILNWIKESLNLDVIVKLLKFSGNESGEENLNMFSEEDDIPNDGMSYYSGCQYVESSPKIGEKENLEIKNINSNSSSKSELRKPDFVINNINIPSQKLERQSLKEAYINDKKEKLCKIILDLINNPSRIKKNPSKHSLSQSEIIQDSFNLSESQKFQIITNKGIDCQNKIYNNILNSNFCIKQESPTNNNNESPVKLLMNDSKTSKNSEAFLNRLKPENENFERWNNMGLMEDVDQPCILKNDSRLTTPIDDSYRINNINSQYNTVNNKYAYASVLDKSQSEYKANLTREETNTNPFTTQPQSFIKRNLVEDNKSVSNTSNNLSNNTYYNPNMNSYINIVTINLSCKDEVKIEDSYHGNLNSNQGEDNSVNRSNYVNNNSHSHANDTQADDENIKKILSRKLMMIEYQKLIKSKGAMPNMPNIGNFSNQSQCNLNPTNINVITNYNHLNITNGECNITNSGNEKEQDKDLNLISDAFKISFDESFSTFNNPHAHLIEENDINKLNLDLDHFFNMDNL